MSLQTPIFSHALSVSCGFALRMYLFLRRPHVWRNRGGDFSLLCNLYVLFCFIFCSFMQICRSETKREGRERRRPRRQTLRSLPPSSPLVYSFAGRKMVESCHSECRVCFHMRRIRPPL